MNKCDRKSSVESGELKAKAKTMTFVLVLAQFRFRKKADKMADRRKIKFRVCNSFVLKIRKSIANLLKVINAVKTTIN